MALFDTGLGWYAEESWLRNFTGVLGTLVGGEGGSTRGKLNVYTGTVTRQGAITQGNEVFTCVWGQLNRGIAYESSLQDGVYVAWYGIYRVYVSRTLSRFDLVQAYQNYGDVNSFSITMTRDQTSGVYYAYFSMNEFSSWSRLYGDLYPDLPTLLSAYKDSSTEIAVSKNNAGYCVPFAVILKYNNVEFVSIGSISTNSQYNAMTASSPPGASGLDYDGAISSTIFRMHMENMLSYDISDSGRFEFFEGSKVHVIDMTDLNVTSVPPLQFGGYIFTQICMMAKIGVGSATDPNAQGGTSTTGGGTGDFTAPSDSIPLNNLPTVTAVDAGFITLFNPTLVQLNNLSGYMWANLVSFETIRKLFADPMDAILGLNVVPVDIPSTTSREVKVGGISTGVTMDVADSQYVNVPCGTIQIQEYWGSALDYSPYTKIQLFLPYIGFVQLDTDDVMGRQISIMYRVDILTGSCLAQIHVYGGTRSQVSAIMYSFAGHCAQNVPVTGVNFGQIIASALTATTTVITAAVAGPAAGAAVGAAESNLTSAMVKGVEIAKDSDSTSSQKIGAMANVDVAAAVVSRSEAAFAQNIVGGISNTVSQVMGAKPAVAHSGSLNSVAGLMGRQKPYVIITRPRQSLAANYNHYVGYPSNITENFSNLHGYTTFEQVVLENIGATDSEMAELYELLKGGVYF